MAEIIWTEAALSDIDAIADFVSHDSPARARQVIRKIFQSAEPLADFPEIGRVIPEIGENHRREVFCYSYRLMYLLRDGKVYVEAIYHGARDYRP